MAVRQSAAQKRTDNSLELAAYEREYPDPHADQRSFESVGDCAADQHFNTSTCHLPGLSEWVPVFQEDGLPANFGAIGQINHAQFVRYVKNGRYISLPTCYCYDHDHHGCNIHTTIRADRRIQC